MVDKSKSGAVRLMGSEQHAMLCLLRNNLQLKVAQARGSDWLMLVIFPFLDNVLEGGQPGNGYSRMMPKT